jgi:sugar phosphate isomerase/epimerase
MNTLQIALQLYTVRDETSRDFAGTLRQVAAMGYAGVEFAGYGDLSAQAMSALLAKTGLQAASTHLGLAELTGERLDASIEYCQAIGCPKIVLPWLAPEWRTLEGLQTLAPRFNAIGQHCLDAGITFGYHNHDFEFMNLGERSWFDHFLEATDSVLVKVELDVYWVAHAGRNPLALLNILGERITLIHFKDMASDGSMTEVGQGTLDMQEITSFAQQQHIWVIVEHDHPTLPSLQSARLSLAYFR